MKNKMPLISAQVASLIYEHWHIAFEVRNGKLFKVFVE